MQALGDYVARPNVIRAHGRIEVPGQAQLKVYTLMPYESSTNGHFGDDELEVLEDGIISEIRGKRLDTQEGLGFAIFSDGAANVNFWGSDPSSQLHPNIYYFDRKKLDNGGFRLHRQLIERAGAYCCKEGIIVGHESRAWQEFLMSPGSNQDRNKYLHDFFQEVASS